MSQPVKFFLIPRCWEFLLLFIGSEQLQQPSATHAVTHLLLRGENTIREILERKIWVLVYLDERHAECQQSLLTNLPGCCAPTWKEEPLQMSPRGAQKHQIPPSVLGPKPIAAPSPSHPSACSCWQPPQLISARGLRESAAGNCSWRETGSSCLINPSVKPGPPFTGCILAGGRIPADGSSRRGQSRATLLVCFPWVAYLPGRRRDDDAHVRWSRSSPRSTATLRKLHNLHLKPHFTCVAVL